MTRYKAENGRPTGKCVHLVSPNGTRKGSGGYGHSPHFHQMLDAATKAMVKVVLPHNARDAWVGQDVSIACLLSAATWEGPVLLSAACTHSHQSKQVPLYTNACGGWMVVHIQLPTKADMVRLVASARCATAKQQVLSAMFPRPVTSRDSVCASQQ